MRRHLGVTLSSALGVVALVGLVGMNDARAGVVGSMHDLTTTATPETPAIPPDPDIPGDVGTPAIPGKSINQPCKFCHTPHNSADPAGMPVPLWNRQNPTGTFAMYSSVSLNMAIASGPQGVSLACLSCHDGVTAYDALINVPWGWGAPGQIANTMRAEFAIGGDTETLTNDHPISITYNPSLDPGAFASVLSGKVGTLPLYRAPLAGGFGTQVECATCHDVHNFTPYPPFLRKSNTGSALCLTCHIK